MRKTLQKSAALLMLSLFGAASGWAQSTLYSIDFTSSEPTGWTTVDNSTTPGSTWFYGKGGYVPSGSSYYQIGCARLSSDTNSEQDDYYVSPGVQLQAGKTYVVSVSNQVQSSPTSLGIEVGTSQTDMSQNTVLKSAVTLGSLYNGAWYQYEGITYASTSELAFTPEADGTYYFSMRGKEPQETSDVYSRIFVYDFSVKEAAAISLPYTQNFIESTEGWTALDANNSGKTFKKDLAYYVDGYEGTQTFPYMQDESYASSVDDYWVSPGFLLEAGQSYKAAFDVLQTYGASTFASRVELTLGKYNDDASSFKKVADLTLAADDPTWGYTAGSTDPHVFAVKESGRYFIAAHATGHEGAATYGYVGFKAFSLDTTDEAAEVTVDFNAQGGGETPDPDPEVETKALPYTVDFSVEGSADAAEWTVVDKSATAYSTWKYGSKYTASGTVNGFKIDDDDYNSDDYLVSPAFKLEAGKTYNVDLTNYAYTYGADLFIEYGTNKDDVTSFTQLVQTARATVNGEKITGPYELTVPADGVYYIALRAKANTSVQDSPYYTYLVVSDFGLSEKNGGGETPDPGKPDVEGTLPYSITFDSADKFDEWTAYDNSDTKGTTWEYSASDFAGKPSAGFLKKDDGGASDLLISPKFQLKEGKTYTIKVDMAASDDNGATLDLNYFKGTKDIDGLKSIAYIGSTIPVKDENDNVKDSWTLDVTQDGDYWFAFRVYGPWSWDAKQGTGISIYSVNITENADEAEDEAVALPYSTDFSTEAGTTGWTAMDRSENTQSTWRWRENSYCEYDENWQVVGDPHTGVAFDSDGGTNANDYWVSPAFNLTAGNTYTIKTHTTTNRSCFSDGKTAFTMKLGTNKKVQSTFDQTIGTIALSTVYDRAADEFEFSPSESGKYYVAYNIYNEEGSSAYGYIFDFSIEEKVEPVAEIPYSITFDSADKFAEWSTIDKSDTKGVTWEYTASDFAGKSAATIGYDASGSCDFLVSPKFQLKGGKTYVFKADMASKADNGVQMILDIFKGSKTDNGLNSFDWVGTTLPKTNNGEVQDEWTIDIDEDSNYWFAFRALAGYNGATENDGLSVYSVSITEEADDPVALPYSTDFSTEAGTKGWKAFDCSTDKGQTWSYNSYGYQQFDASGNTVGDNHPCVGYGPEWDSENVANDYYTSPAFTLEAGKTYVVSTNTTASLPCIEDGNTKFTLKLGKERKNEASYDTTIGEIALNNVYDRDADTFEFTVPETGVYHVAYNAFNNDGNKVYVYVFNFSLAEKETVVPASVTELKAVELTDTKQVKLTWTNPTKDAKGNDLANKADLMVKVYEGETLLTTFENEFPGSVSFYTYTPETFEGTHSYKVVALLDGAESEAATTELTIVVDGINGIVAIPAGAKVSVHTMGGALVGSDIQNLAKGTYIVTVKTVDGAVKTVKINK